MAGVYKYVFFDPFPWDSSQEILIYQGTKERSSRYIFTSKYNYKGEKNREEKEGRKEGRRGERRREKGRKRKREKKEKRKKVITAKVCTLESLMNLYKGNV